MERLYALGAGIFMLLNLSAQTPVAVSEFHNNFKIHIKHSARPVTIDGILDDSIWMQAEPATHFSQMAVNQGSPKEDRSQALLR
jgi:hypothetical protein